MMKRPHSVKLLTQYALTARANVEKLALREALTNSKGLRGYCAIASRHLWMIANHLHPVLCAGLFRKYDTTYTPGTYEDVSGHVWLELDGWIVDITATQFAGIESKIERHFDRPVYVSRANNPHYYKTHSGEKAFERIRSWHEAPLDHICATLVDHTSIINQKKRKLKQ
jgi:hypothetical protein